LGSVVDIGHLEGRHAGVPRREREEPVDEEETHFDEQNKPQAYTFFRVPRMRRVARQMKRTRDHGGQTPTSQADQNPDAFLT
jgi:hypothetical protein